MLEKKLMMNELFDLNHKTLRRKEYAKRIYNAATTKDKKQEIIKLGRFKDVPYYDQIGRVKSGKKTTFDKIFLIDTNQNRITEFTSTLAKLRLAYEKSSMGFFERCGNFDRFIQQFFSAYYALLDNSLGILKKDYSSVPSMKQFLSYEEMLEFGGNIRIYYRDHIMDCDFWENYGKTATSLDKVINEVMHPHLAKMFDNVPRAVCGVDLPPNPTPVIIDGKISISSFPLVYPEKLKVKPEYKKEFEKYKSQYDTNCEAFRIHKL